MVILLMIGFILLGIFDRKTILKGKRKKTYVLYFSLLVMGFIIQLLLVIGKAPISPAIIIEKIVRLFIR